MQIKIIGGVDCATESLIEVRNELLNAGYEPNKHSSTHEEWIEVSGTADDVPEIVDILTNIQ